MTSGLNELALNNHNSFFHPDIESASFSLALAALTLGQALQTDNGFYSLPAFVWLTASLVCLGYALIARRKQLPVILRKFLELLLISGLAWQIYQLANSVPGIFHSPSFPRHVWLFIGAISFAGGCALLSLLPETRIPPSWSNILAGLTLFVLSLAGIFIIKISPHPFIDTYVFQQTSSHALLHRTDPYTLRAPNIYGDMQYYGKKLGNRHKLTIGNPYPPLSIYFSTLGYIAGKDVRYSDLLAIIGSGALIAFLHPGRSAKLAAYIFLFTPRVFYVLESSWTEPIVVFFLTLTIFCAFRYPRWLPVALGLLFASKQYFIFLIPLALLFSPLTAVWRNWLKFYGWMVGVAIAVTAPLAFWNLRDFLWNVGGAQWYQIFRLDALSYLTLYAHLFNQIPSALLSFVALAVAYLVVWRFSPRTATGFVISTAWCLEMFFAFNKQAFANYYFLVIGTICCALSAITAQRPILEENTLIEPELNLVPDASVHT
jgi:hypothetical protein